MGAITGNSIGSVLYFQLVEDVTPVPMMIVTEDGKIFSRMMIHKGFEQIRKDQGEDIAEIIFLAMGSLGGEKEYFRWLKPGEEAQLKPPVDYYRVLDMVEVVIGK